MTSSISKIKKIRALTKKCIEKGVQKFLFLKKPHSKGEGFSCLFVSFSESKIASIMIIAAMHAIVNICSFSKIIY